MAEQNRIILSAEQLRLVELLAGQGLTEEQIAVDIGISRGTLQNRAKDTPEVRYALEKGWEKANSTVTKTAFRMATSGRNTVMTIFWLKCRANWAEPQYVKHEHSGTINFAKLLTEAIPASLLRPELVSYENPGSETMGRAA